MKIAFVEIQNFRKLKACHIDFSEKTTLFVGANNSGKTSAMEALIRFLKERSKFSYTDFTISNWDLIQQIGDTWLPGSNAPVDLSAWSNVLPSLDLWFEAQLNELQHISHIIPTLKWTGGLLGVRIRLEPKAIQELFKDYCEAMHEAQQLRTASGASIKSLPENLRAFLESEGQISKYFQLVSYLLDPTKITPPSNSIALPQDLSPTAISTTDDLLKGLVKIDIINAQRGFSDANSSDPANESSSSRTLSSQLKDYYKKHINPMDKPEARDVEAIASIERAQDEFDKKLKKDFENAFNELETLGYPGFSDPKISLSSKVEPIESLSHGTAVQYDVVQGGSPHLRLPEKYNGLGYQNLVSMVFKLILFRDEWMRVGKLRKNNTGSASTPIEPIHLVLIEEPEAHLHAQVQQVFINKAYSVLRKHALLGDKTDFITQMVVSTHSSHIAHECEFSNLRYFRRDPAIAAGDVPKVHVVSLNKVFGPQITTNKFASRYLKTTHCDLFFADAVILVEGPAERILLPGLIKKHFPSLTSRYLTILEIGGSHAHRLQPLIEHLGIHTLVITDLDAVDAKGSAIQPQPANSLNSGNTTLKTWLPKMTLLDDLYAATDVKKISTNKKVRVAYQTPFLVTFNGASSTVYPYTFEDAVILENLTEIKVLTPTVGLLKYAHDYANSTMTIPDICKTLIDDLRKGSRLKAEFALELLCADDNDTIKIPQYIAEGLTWLDAQLVVAPTAAVGVPAP